MTREEMSSYVEKVIKTGSGVDCPVDSRFSFGDQNNVIAFKKSNETLQEGGREERSEQGERGEEWVGREREGERARGESRGAGRERE